MTQMNANQKQTIKIQGCEVRVRPEYFVAAKPAGMEESQFVLQGGGGLATYNTLKPSAPEPYLVKRVFACHRRGNELLLLASFWLN